MHTVCLTAGLALPDVLWAASVLPALRQAHPELRVVWECPVSHLGQWLTCYPELDAVVGDVEEMDSPPDAYAILHPFWHRAEWDESPVGALFALMSAVRPVPAVCPARPYCPPVPANQDRPAGLPESYVVLDPDPGVTPAEETAAGQLRSWSHWVALLPISVVQVGSTEVTLLPGAMDARGTDIVRRAATIAHGRLFAGADSGSSCLAQALERRQIWLASMGSDWLWPRASGPLSTVCRPDSSGSFDHHELVDLAVARLVAGDCADGR